MHERVQWEAIEDPMTHSLGTRSFAGFGVRIFVAISASFAACNDASQSAGDAATPIDALSMEEGEPPGDARDVDSHDASEPEDGADACVACDADARPRDADFDRDPIVTIVAPTSAPTLETWRRSIAISGVVTAMSNVVVECRTQRSTCGTSTVARVWSFPSVPLEEGSNRVEITARDEKDRTTSAALEVTRARRSAGAKRAPNPIVIDGRPTEAAWELAHRVDRSITGASDNIVSFGVLWDDDFLYVGAEVLDDRLIDDSLEAYADDSIEFYLDPDASGGRSGDGRYDPHDRQYILAWNDAELTIFDGHFRRLEAPATVRHAIDTLPGAIGYTVELAIPWSSTNIVPRAGATIGFDVQANDDDYGGAIQESFGWNGDDGSNHRYPAGFGVVVLLSEMAAPD